jgi:hypothetical protein
MRGILAPRENSPDDDGGNLILRIATIITSGVFPFVLAERKKWDFGILAGDFGSCQNRISWGFIVGGEPG